MDMVLITRGFLPGSLAISIPDEVAAHKRYQPWKCSVRDIQGMSKNNPCLVIMICTLTLFISPLQLRPSPVYPALQVQLYEPWVLTQSALAWHLCVAEVHSLTSNKKKKKQINKHKKNKKQTNNQEKNEIFTSCCMRMINQLSFEILILKLILTWKKKSFSHIPTFFVSFLVPFASA